MKSGAGARALQTITNPANRVDPCTLAHAVSAPSSKTPAMALGKYVFLESTYPIGPSGGRMETRVTLKPGNKGTKKLVTAQAGQGRRRTLAPAETNCG